MQSYTTKSGECVWNLTGKLALNEWMPLWIILVQEKPTI